MNPSVLKEINSSFFSLAKEEHPVMYTTNRFTYGKDVYHYVIEGCSNRSAVSLKIFDKKPVLTNNNINITRRISSYVDYYKKTRGISSKEDGEQLECIAQIAGSFLSSHFGRDIVDYNNNSNNIIGSVDVNTNIANCGALLIMNPQGDHKVVAKAIRDVLLPYYGKHMAVFTDKEGGLLDSLCKASESDPSIKLRIHKGVSEVNKNSGNRIFTGHLYSYV